MLIEAKMMLGKIILLQVQSNISAVKKKIQKITGVSRNKQKLIYQGEVLDYNKTMDEYQIVEKSMILVRLKGGILIFAETMDGKTVSFDEEKTEKIIDIKMKIQEKTGLHSDEQKLVFQGGTLDDDKTVDEYQIVEKSMILVRLKYGMQIFVKTMDGKTVAFGVKKTEKISDIKKKIQEKIGLHPDEQILVFQGVILNDEKTVDEYQIVEKSVINVLTSMRGGMQIFAITMDGKTVSFEVQKTEKIIDIQKKIQEKMGLHPDEQKLVFQGWMLDDNKTVDEYQIAEKSVINIVAKLRGIMQILAITMDGKTVALDVKKTAKIIDIKKKIQEKIGLYLDEQILVFQGGILNDDKTVDEYQIVEKSVILVRLRGGMLIFAITMDGKTVSFDVEKTEKIIDIKKKIQEKTGLHPDEQKLVFQGGTLDDDKTVDEYQIVEKSEIFVRLR